MSNIFNRQFNQNKIFSLERKPAVIHLYRSEFLPITETFIETQIRGLKKFTPVVFARKIGSRFLFEEKIKIFARKRSWLMSAARMMSPSEKRFFLEIAKKGGGALLHAHFASDAWYFMPLKKASGLPLAVSFYGYDAYQLPKKFFGLGKKIILKQVFKNADLIIVPSRHMAKHLTSLGCDNSKIEILPWGTDINKAERFKNRLKEDNLQNSWNGKNRPVRFINIGRMVEKKGHIFLLKAFKEILDKGINAELAIIGDGPLKKKILRALDKLQICAKVRIIGKLSNEEAKKELSRSDIYVHPSVIAKNGDQEGIPTSIMEAFSAKLPVIAAAHSGIPEIVKDGINGIIVSEKNDKMLARAMEVLAKNPDLRRKFGEAGFKMVERDFNAEKQAEKLEELYRRLSLRGVKI